jgi:sugar lactone lactonase YvrE
MKSFARSTGLVAFLLLGLTGRLPAASDYSVPYAFNTVAGDSSIGSEDGPGKSARFYSPRGIAVDANGNVYVADTVNNTIRKITPAGMVSTLAGTARVFGVGMSPDTRPPFDGTGPNAIFNNPEGIAVDQTGVIYVTDKMAFQVRRVTPEGVVTTIAGAVSQIGPVDGTGPGARFGAASGAAVDAAGNLYVSEWTSHVIRKVTPAGVVTTIAGKADQSGNVDGTGDAARFFQPNGLAIDGDGNLYVADTINCTIRKVTPAGVVTTVAGLAGSAGHVDGDAATARFRRPMGVARDASGNMYVADSFNSVIRKITPAGVVSTLAGQPGIKGSTDGVGAAAQFRTPTSLAVDAAGFIYVADEADNTIRKVAPDGTVTTLAGLGIDFSFGNNDGLNARFDRLGSAAVGPAGEVYVADTFNATIRKVAPDGVVTTFAGKAGVRGHADGPGADARFDQPYALTLAADGSLYVADPGNDTIRKITPAGVVTTLAGDPVAPAAHVDGAGSDARFSFPSGIVADATGAVYVADSDNHVIRRISATGEVTTIAGQPGMDGDADGTGTTARFREPAGLALDATGNLLVADTAAQTIRKVTPAGVVTTVAGKAGVAGETDGDLATARFQNPAAVTADAGGNVYVADAGNHLIRRISADGKVTTLGGLVRADGYANGVGVRSRFTSPPGIAIDRAGRLLVTSGATLRAGRAAGPVTITTQPQGLSRVVGESASFSVAASGVPDPTYQWYRGDAAIAGATSATLSLTNVQSTDAGDYTVVVANSLGQATSSKATLAVTAPVTPPPSTPPNPATGSGGGGAPSPAFLFALALLAGLRRLRSAT